ncbi:MAG: ABC transporter ATP-binding protein, partial [Chloroflexi bacterium]|nr:ABC transporter ATP-binding protein [Chloroflexota bacterium]
MTELREMPQAMAEESKALTRPLAIECRALSKSFGSKPVLRRIDLMVEEGERLVVFGPNGAGKTTLMKVLATLTSPSGGGVRLAGLDLREDAALIRRQIGVVSHRPYLYDELTARENLKFYGKMYGLANLAARIEEVADYVGLRQRLNDRVRT